MAEITIERLGHLGDGIASDGTLVARALPGERVEGDAAEGRIADPRILEPSPRRVRPPCKHYKQCGGCALQHADDAFVSEWKAEVVTRALSARGLEAEIARIHTSPPRSRRRAVLSGRRVKSGALVGFHARRSDTIVPISDCSILAPELMEVVPVLAELTALGGTRKGELSFALTASATGVDLAVTGGKPLDRALSEALPAFARHFIRLTWGDETVFTDRAPVLHFGPAAVTPPPGAFLQATAEGEAALRGAVERALAGADSIVDLFAGCGTFTLPLAARAPVHAVDAAGSHIDALDHAVRHTLGLKRVTTSRRDLFREPLPAEDLAAYDAAVIDPPRAGAEAQTRELARARLPRIAMVSCNPVTFARDAQHLLEAGYRIEWIEVVDQFRWSPHVELVALLTLPHIDGGRNEEQA